MLQDLGHSDIFDALKQAKDMQTALKVIYTWAGCDSLEAKSVRELCGRALGKD
jgi:hypothetical protein